MTTAQKTRLQETTFSKQCRVDRDAGIIYDVKLCGRVSKNGREYSDPALADCRRLYEERDVNIDHISESDRRKQVGGRPVEDFFAVARNCKVADDGVYGDLHYLKSHALAESICERAEKFPTKFGMSHDAHGVTIPGKRGSKDIVESVETVDSIDVVSRPATTQGLFEGETMTTNTTVQKLLESAKKDKRARGLMKLLEMDEFAAMAEEPVEVEEPVAEMGADDQIKSAFRTMVMAAFDDESLDMTATVSRIKEILKAQDKLAEKPAEKKPDASDGGDSEAVAEGLSRIDKMERRQLVRDTLEDAGLTRGDIGAERYKLLEGQADEDAMIALVNSWPKSLARRGEKPKVGRRVQEGEGEDKIGSYDDELKKTGRGRAATK